MTIFDYKQRSVLTKAPISEGKCGNWRFIQIDNFDTADKRAPHAPKPPNVRAGE